MTYLSAVLRGVVGVAALSALLATLLDTESRSSINPRNFFGFFTLQSNTFTALVLIVTAVVTARGRKQPRALVLARGCVTTYIVIVGTVYNTLLVRLPGGVEFAWANTVLHVVVPICVAIDWVFFGDRPTLEWNRFWIVLVYPVVWLIVVLFRGATDGWVPYPFLDPAQGYGVVALYCVGIAVAIGLVGVGVWLVSRVSLLGRVTPSSRREDGLRTR